MNFGAFSLDFDLEVIDCFSFLKLLFEVLKKKKNVFSFSFFWFLVFYLFVYQKVCEYLFEVEICFAWEIFFLDIFFSLFG